MDNRTISLPGFPSVRLHLKTERGFALCDGIVTLLNGIRDHGSLRQAAINMDMAYSKAWRIVHEAEDILGFELICYKDGVASHGFTLTDKATRIVDTYLQAEARMLNIAVSTFFDKGFVFDIDDDEPDELPTTQTVEILYIDENGIADSTLLPFDGDWDATMAAWREFCNANGLQPGWMSGCWVLDKGCKPEPR